MANQSKRDAPTANKLLAALSPTEFERLRPSLETVRLRLGQVIYNQGEPIRDAYFPESGTVSLLSVTEEGLSIEVAIVGSEGMIGLPLVLGIITAPFQTIVQVEGCATKIPVRALREEFRKIGKLHDVLLRARLCFDRTNLPNRNVQPLPYYRATPLPLAADDR